MTSETKWEKLPAIERKYGGCLNCGPRPDTFAPDMRIGVGFGMAALTRDGSYVAGEEPGMEWDALMTGAQAEALAVADPDHDWRIVLDGPLSGRTYQRHGSSEWVLVEQNRGFA